jgi:hypothetical protein
MALVRNGDTDYGAIYNKWFDEGARGWVTYSGVQYKLAVDVAGVIAFDSYTTTDLLDSRSIIGSAPTTYSKLDDGGP